MRRYAPLIFLVLAFLFVGSLYAVYTPDWQAPDEPAHYNYVRQLAAGRLPVIEPGDYDQAYQSRVISSKFDPQYPVTSFEYEDYQPPLYYLLQTPVYWLFGGALRPLRLLSVAFGAGVIILAYFVALRLFPGREWLALTVAAFVAFLPQHVAMLAAMNNDSLAELLIAAILLVLIGLSLDRGTDPSQKTPFAEATPANEYRTLLLLGFILGLGFLTKVTVYIMAPVIGLALSWLYWGQWQRFLRAGLAVFGIAALIGLGWWLRNLAVYGDLDLLGTQAHNAIVVGQPRTAEWIAERGYGGMLGAFTQTTFQSFWGQFGWMGVVMPGWVYRPLLLFSLMTMMGLAWLAITGRGRIGTRSAGATPQPEDRLVAARYQSPAPLIIMGGTFGLSLLIYLAYNVTFVQHQGRYLFPALIPIGVGVALAWATLLGPLTRRWPWLAYLLPASLALGLFALDLLALFRFIVPSLS